MGALDYDAERYRLALAVAERQGITEEQVRDSHRWGSRTRPTLARFDWRGRAR